MIDASVLFDTLSNDRRWLVRYCLEDADGELTVGWLVDRMLSTAHSMDSV